MPRDWVPAKFGCDVETGDSDPYGVDVQWGPFGSDVSIGAGVMHQSRRDYLAELIATEGTTEDSVTVGRKELAALIQSAGRAAFYVTLNRSSINHLIRHLRRARNAAYGTDE